MPSTNFDNLIRQHPDLATALRFVARWAKKQKSGRIFLEPVRMANELPDEIALEELTAAVRKVAHELKLEKCYRVVDPHTRTYVGGIYRNIEDVPRVIRNDLNQQVKVEFFDIVPVLLPDKEAKK